MSAFTSFDAFVKIPKTEKLYELGDVLVWYMAFNEPKFPLEIPKGYRVDASVPWYLEWALDPHNPDNLFAAAIHDYLLEHGCDRAVASAEFRRALRARGVRPIKAWPAFVLTLLYTELT